MAMLHAGDRNENDASRNMMAALLIILVLVPGQRDVPEVQPLY